MKKLIGSLAVLPLVTAGVLTGSGSAQAMNGRLTPPPPDSTASFAPFLINPNQAGAKAFIRTAPAGIPPIGSFTPTQVFILDFLPYQDIVPPATGFGGTVGVVPPGPYAGLPGTVANTTPTTSNWGAVGIGTTAPSPPLGVFANVQGDIGLLADLILPYAGVPFNAQINYPLAKPVPLLDFHQGFTTPGPLPPDGQLLGLIDSVDTFTANTLVSVRATNLPGGGSSIELVFDGYWNIDSDTTAVIGTIDKYQGTVVLSQVLTNTIEQLQAGALTPGGITRSFNGSTDVLARAPEPSALGGLAAVVLGAASLLRKRQKQQ